MARHQQLHGREETTRGSFKGEGLVHVWGRGDGQDDADGFAGGCSTPSVQGMFCIRIQCSTVVWILSQTFTCEVGQGLCNLLSAVFAGCQLG